MKRHSQKSKKVLKSPKLAASTVVVVLYDSYWKLGLTTAHFTPFCSHFLFRTSQKWNLVVESQRRDASFPVRDSKKLSRAIGTDRCVCAFATTPYHKTVPAVYLKMVTTALQISYTYLCIIYSSSVNNLFQTGSCSMQLVFFQCFRS